MPVNQRIAELRKKRGLSQYDLAGRINSLNQSQLSKIKNGNRKISVQGLTEIAKALDVDVTEILETNSE